MGFHHRKLLHLYKLSLQQSPLTQPLPVPLPDDEPSPEIIHFQALRIAMIFMACMGMLLCTVSITLRYYYYSRRRRHNHNQSSRSTPTLFDVNGDSPNSDEYDDDNVERVIDHPIWYTRTAGLQQSVIDSITVFKYRKDEELIIAGTECSVCLGDFQQDESLRLLPKCSHAFHIPCIDTWLRSHKNCPLCRAPAVTNDSSNVSGETRNNETQVENFDGAAVAASESESGSYHVGQFESIGNNDDDDCGISSSETPGKILPVRRSVSMDSSSASVIFRDVVESERSFGSETHFGVKVSSSSKHGGRGKFKRLLLKKPVLMRRSFSHNRKVLFSRHCRSHSSSTLPL